MNEQLKDLMKRAQEAYEEKQKREHNQRFLIWFENTFDICNYEKKYINNRVAAKIEGITFCCSQKNEGFEVEVFADCRQCLKFNCYSEKIPNLIGVVSNLEELGKFVQKDEIGNYHFDCGNHLFPYDSVPNLFAVTENQSEN